MGTPLSNERQAETATTAAAATSTTGTGREEIMPAANPAASRPPISDRDEFRIRCLSSALYHEDRERYFAWTHRLAMFIVVASGTAAISPLKTELPIFPIIITLFGLLDLVFDLSGKARLHSTLRKQAYSVLADIGCEPLQTLEKRLTLIYADEPPCMYAVNAVAYNRAMAAFGRPEQFMLEIGFWPNFFRHIVPYAPASFKAKDEVGEVA